MYAAMLKTLLRVISALSDVFGQVMTTSIYTITVCENDNGMTNIECVKFR